MKKTLLIFIVALIFIGGCVNIDIEQKIKRNGLVDMSFEITTSMPMILDELKESIVLSNENEFPFEVVEKENGIAYVFENIDPAQANLFEQDDEDVPLDSISNLQVSYEFRFPYYYYTIEIDMSDSQNNLENKSAEEISLGEAFDMVGDEMSELFAEMFKITYTLETFGKITDTNGELISSNTVKYNLNDVPDDKVFVEFRDIFLLSLFANAGR